MRLRVRRAAGLSADVRAPGDKSISHRALILGAHGFGTCHVAHPAPGEDLRSTAACLVALGVRIDIGAEEIVVHGPGLDALRSPSGPLDCGNSGTTLRLLAGLVAGAGVSATLDGDASLRTRPMRRVLEPLAAMGARCRGTPEGTAPLRFEAGPGLSGREHRLALASAQVKTCLLLAGLRASGITRVLEPVRSRDHTERMLQAFGAPLRIEPDGAVCVERLVRPLALPERLEVPGDPSSAAFWIAAGLLTPGASVAVRSVDVNPTRTGFLDVLGRMGAEVSRVSEPDCAGDPVATLRVRGGGRLRGVTIHPDEVPSLLDEVPVLAVIASQAHGETRVSGAEELRVKESDRLAQVVRALRAMGARVEERPDGFSIDGPCALRGASIDAARDHRIAMAFAVAGLVADGTTEIDGAEWADTSYPGFFAALATASGGALQ